MLKCLIVIAHPLQNSLCRSFSSDVVAQLTAAGHSVDVEDLYASDFSPALTAAERARYFDAVCDGSAVADQTARLQSAEALVLCFPTWWFGYPAILKGWIDRVWLPGIAYHNSPNSGPIQPAMLQLRHAMVITTLGAPWWVDWLVMWRPLRRNMGTALLRNCAPNARLRWFSLYQAEVLAEPRLSRFRNKISAALARW